MNAQNPGRHRAPGGHSLLSELRNIARESAQPALKCAVVLTAAGGLLVSYAGSANAEANGVTASAQAAPAVPAAVGPPAGAPLAGSALAAIGFPQAAAKPAAPATSSAPAATRPAAPAQVIRDLVVEQDRAVKAAAAKAATKKAATKKAAARQAVADRTASKARASRSVSRQSLTSSTATTKSRVNSAPSAASGQRASSNWATPGQCTWGALSKWYQSEGYYPGGWTGNARAWASGAARAGYTVTGTPRVRSIVVLQPGVHGSSSSAGHVGWVTAVNGNKVTIVEMNALAGAYNYNTRTLTDIGGMQYIYAP